MRSASQANGDARAPPRMSPRTERHHVTTSPRTLLFSPPSSPRHFDPDGVHSDAFDDRDIFGRHVADQRSPHSHNMQFTSNNASPHGRALLSRTLAPSSVSYFDSEKSMASPRPAMAVRPLSPTGPPSTLAASRGPRHSPSKMRPLQVLRPYSPVGDAPPESVFSLQMMQQLSPRGTPRKAILTAPDAHKISAWLRSLQREARQFSSYFLYSEMLFRESDVLLHGKTSPNRLQTAIAFHCLCQASSVFGRHEGILRRICRDLGAAIFIPLAESALPGSSPSVDEGDEMEVLEFYANQLTYYDHQRVLQQQRDDMEHNLKVQVSQNTERAKEDQMNQAKIKDLEARYKIKALDKITHRNTANEELNEKLQGVLENFQYMDESEKQKVVLGVIDALRAHVTADTLITITSQISLYEKDKLLRELFQDDIAQLTDKIRSEVISTSSAQQNAILEQSAARITRFHTLIAEKLRGSNGAEDDGRSRLDDVDLCDQDRKVLESLADMMDDLQAMKQKNAELEQQLHDAEQAVNNLRWKTNQHLNEAQDQALQHAREIAELKEEFAKPIVQTEEKEMQTDRLKRGNRSDGSGDGDEEDEEGESGGGAGGSGRNRRRRGGAAEEEDELIVKNRRLNKNGYGIASLIEAAKIPASKIRKILSKRKPLTLNELHTIIVGYYQAKMSQDIQDDLVSKPRSNLAQFIMDMYTLHYGLKDLAISQVVFLDASIRKYASDSARVRTFGLLTGSLEPESHACSVQGIDFFLFAVVVIFNAGMYKRGRKQSVHVAQNLKSFFGDGIFMNPNLVVLKCEVICSSIDMIFSYTRNEPGGTLDRLKDEVRLLCSSPATSTSGGMDIDAAMEKIMGYWFMLYEKQIVDIHAMFANVDTNGDGNLDFSEFCEVVQVLEPGMDRRDALVMYNKAAGDDHVIDKNEFVQVMLAHQRGSILKDFNSNEYNKKSSVNMQQRKASNRLVLAPPPQYKTLAGGMAHLDREESYVSLAAAMSAVSDELVSESEEEEDADADDGKDGSPAQDNVSFMTLSKLSLWASEAKGKLLGVAAPAPKPERKASPFPPIGLRQSSPGLARIAEQSQDSFEKDVNALLEEALSKANIDLHEVL